MSQKLRIGILGCGKMGRVYARWFASNPHCRVTAFYNRTRSRAEELSSIHPGSKVFDRWQDLAGSDEIDAIGICTPSHEHLEQFKTAVAGNKHILCEKPMANDINQARYMVKTAENYSKTVMVGFQMRFHPVIQKVDRLLPKIGRIFHLDFVFGMHRTEITWRHNISEGGGVLKELASHLFDLGCHWLGKYESIASYNRIIRPGREVEDYSINIFNFKNGAAGYLSTNYEDRRGRSIKGNLMGLDGQIEFQFSSYDPGDSQVTLYIDGENKQIPLDIPGEIDEVYPGHMDSFKKEIDEFTDCILNGKNPRTGCREGAYAIEIIDAAYESSRSREMIRLPLTEFNSSGISGCFKVFGNGKEGQKC